MATCVVTVRPSARSAVAAATTWDSLIISALAASTWSGDASSGK